MSKRKKELVGILALLVVLTGLYVGVRLFVGQDAELITKIEVRLKDEVVQEIDLDKNGVYEIEVELGHLYVEVKDGKYRVFDVDCPDKICERTGWVSKGSETLIVCLPNNIVIVQG